MTLHTFSWTERPFTGLGVQNTSDPSLLIFLLHGYMGDAPSNMTFANELATLVPDSAVIVPNGLTPVPALNDPTHRQWWELSSDTDPRCTGTYGYLYPPKQRTLMEKTLPCIRFTAGILNRFIIRTAAMFRKRLSDCAVVGISQGGMTGWEMTLFRKELAGNNGVLGAFVAIGAGIVKPERPLASSDAAKIPVFIAGGNQDDFFPPAVNDFSESVLKERGLTVARVQTDSIHYGLEHAVSRPVASFLNGIRLKNESVP